MSGLVNTVPAGAEMGSDGLVHGRDPRQMTKSELTAMGFEPMSAQEAIRAHCLDCCAGSADEVRKCMALRCPSWPFRMGRSPWKAERVLSDEQREAMRERARTLAGRKAAGFAAHDNSSSFGAGTGGAATTLPAAPQT